MRRSVLILVWSTLALQACETPLPAPLDAAGGRDASVVGDAPATEAAVDARREEATVADDARTGDATGQFPDTSLPVCTSLSLSGEPATVEYVAGPIAVPSGGTVADGTYRLTAIRAYRERADSDGFLRNVRSRIALRGARYEQVAEIFGMVGSVAGRVEYRGTSMGLLPDCGGSMPSGSSYTATDGELRLYSTGTMTEMVFTRD